METDRLFVRNFTENDTQNCFENFGQDKSIGKYIPLFPMQGIQEMHSFVKALSQNENAWAVAEKKYLHIIGYITVDIPYPQLEIGEIGYVIGEKFQHKGYAYEAVERILNEYLVNRNLYMIEAKYNGKNTASADLLKKLGFTLDGKLRNRRIDFQTGIRNDLVVCSITKEEYLGKLRRI